MVAKGCRIILVFTIVLMNIVMAVQCIGCSTAKCGVYDTEDIRVVYWSERSEGASLGTSLDGLMMERVTDADIDALLETDVKKIGFLSIRTTWIGSSTNLPSITDMGVRKLATGPKVLVMVLEEQSNITVLSLSILLREQKGLARLIIKSCDKVEAAELHALQDRHPDVVIEFFPREAPPSPLEKRD